MADAVHENYFDSSVKTLNVNWFKVATPTFALNGTTLTISSATQGATIYYVIGGSTAPTTSSTLYTGAINLTDNREIKAIAVLNGYSNSDVATFSKQIIISKGVSFSYDGHYITVTPFEQNATVYYTLDGTSPTEYSKVYKGKISVDKLLTVKAAAMRPYTIMSEVSSMTLKYVYDGSEAIVSEGGLLDEAFKWCGNDAVETLHISGPVNNADLTTIKQLPRLQLLDMENTTMTVLPEEALRGATMRWFTSPKHLTSVGKNTFAECNKLAAITWTTDGARLIPAEFGSQLNPNMLFYVKSESLVGIENANIIANNRARNITLYDGDGYCDFFCPASFVADDISYTRNFLMSTKQGICMGWETLALPFDVQTVTHEKNGELAPFVALGQNDTRKPFWLAQLESNGFVKAAQIKANTPYIISMPNDSAVYADRYLQGGQVTFRAKNATVETTDTDNGKVRMGNVVFVANYEKLDPSPVVYAINLYKRYDATHAEGSIFLPDYRVVKPFEAYTNSTYESREFISIEELSDEATTAIQEFRVDRNDSEALYNLQGLRVKSHGKGVYIKNGKKVLMR